MKPVEVTEETWEQVISVETRGGWTLSLFGDGNIGIETPIKGGQACMSIPKRVWDKIVDAYSLWEEEGAWEGNDVRNKFIKTDQGVWQFWLSVKTYISPKRSRKDHCLGIRFSHPDKFGDQVAVFFFKRMDFDAMVKWYQTDQD